MFIVIVMSYVVYEKKTLIVRFLVSRPFPRTLWSNHGRWSVCQKKCRYECVCACQVLRLLAGAAGGVEVFARRRPRRVLPSSSIRGESQAEGNHRQSNHKLN